MATINTTIAGDSFGSLIHVEVDPVRQQVKKAIAGFLAGYTGQTMTSDRVDLKKWVEWLDSARIAVFDAERAHIELYARWSETRGLAPATIGRRLSTICGFYTYCTEERLLDRNPAAHVRRPKQNYELRISEALGADISGTCTLSVAVTDRSPLHAAIASSSHRNRDRTATLGSAVACHRSGHPGTPASNARTAGPRFAGGIGGTTA